MALKKKIYKIKQRNGIINVVMSDKGDQFGNK